MHEKNSCEPFAAAPNDSTDCHARPTAPCESASAQVGFAWLPPYFPRHACSCTYSAHAWACETQRCSTVPVSCNVTPSPQKTPPAEVRCSAGGHGDETGGEIVGHTMVPGGSCSGVELASRGFDRGLKSGSAGKKLKRPARRGIAWDYVRPRRLRPLMTCCRWIFRKSTVHRAVMVACPPWAATWSLSMRRRRRP